MRRLTDDQITSAAEILLALRAGTQTMGALPSELQPEHAADVQAIIDAVSAQIDRPVRGWKTYTLYTPMQPPFYAPIYDVFPSGAVIPSDISPACLIEPEIMFRLDKDLPKRDRNYTVAEVADAVTAVAGFEVIGSRFRGDSGGTGTKLGALCDHGANGAIVVGDAIEGWRDVAFEDVPLRVTEDDREIVSVVGCHPFDDPFLPAVIGINRLRRGPGAKAGDVVITQSSTGICPVGPGTVIRASYEGLGEVTATFARP